MDPDDLAATEKVNNKQDVRLHSTMGDEHSGSEDSFPKTHLEHPWLSAKRPYFVYPEANGKWMMFFSNQTIDERWQRAVALYVNGLLDGISYIKVSTAMTQSEDSPNQNHVLMFFCGPANDERRVMDIGKCLVANFPPASAVNYVIYYKSNEQTEIGHARRESSSLYPEIKAEKQSKFLYQLRYSPPLYPDLQNPDIREKNVLEELEKSEWWATERERIRLERKSATHVLVFDTETTGFPPRVEGGIGSALDIGKTYAWERCRMLELAWQVYTKNGELIDRQSYLVKPEFNYEIPPQVIEVHKITKEKADSEGIPLNNVLQRFSTALSGVGVIVGHNVQFDFRVVLAESCRQQYFTLVETLRSIPTCCTMAMGREAVGEVMKLAVLFEDCFGSSPLGQLHRADADVEATARIYFYLTRRNRDEKTTKPNDEKPIPIKPVRTKKMDSQKGTNQTVKIDVRSAKDVPQIIIKAKSIDNGRELDSGDGSGSDSSVSRAKIAEGEKNLPQIPARGTNTDHDRGLHSGNSVVDRSKNMDRGNDLPKIPVRGNSIGNDDGLDYGNTATLAVSKIKNINREKYLPQSPEKGKSSDSDRGLDSGIKGNTNITKIPRTPDRSKAFNDVRGLDMGNVTKPVVSKTNKSINTDIQGLDIGRTNPVVNRATVGDDDRGLDFAKGTVKKYVKNYEQDLIKNTVRKRTPEPDLPRSGDQTVGKDVALLSRNEITIFIGAIVAAALALYWLSYQFKKLF